MTFKLSQTQEIPWFLQKGKGDGICTQLSLHFNLVTAPDVGVIQHRRGIKQFKDSILLQIQHRIFPY